jgi:hypothetical protein
MELTAFTSSASLPSIFTAQPHARKRMRDFFSSHIATRTLAARTCRPSDSFLLFVPCAGGRLEIAQQMAAHESARTTGLYDRRKLSASEFDSRSQSSPWLLCGVGDGRALAHR